MYYGYDFCKKCNDKLIERSQTKEHSIEFDRSGDKCPICGEEMILACVSKEKLDSTYQIVLLQSDYEKCLKNTIVNEYIQHKSGMIQKEGDSPFIPLEGDASNTYKLMEFLDENHISYSVGSGFPIERILYYENCSTCGELLVSKEVDLEEPEGYVHTGKYCERCKRWEFFTCVSKVSLDKAVYKLILDKDCVWDRELLKVMQELIGKEEIESKKDTILMEDRAENIRSCGERLKAANIPFHIEPEFPHEILPYEEITEEFLMEILKRQSWYKEEEELGYKGEESKNTFKAT